MPAPTPPSVAVIVPARLASARFPRKLLHPVRGRPLILWTAERISREAPEFPLVFATAEPELAEVLAANGYACVPTDPDLPSGTDRLAAANAAVQADIVINVQADEPLVTGEQIRQLAELAATSDCALATLAIPFRDPADFADPNRVKVVRDHAGHALIFSRAPIPHLRDSGGIATEQWLAGDPPPALLHLGLYAYRADFLGTFASLPPGRLEQIERLEQLRALENGYSIAVGITHQPTVGVDVPADLPRLEAALD